MTELGYLVIDNVTLEEAKKIMSMLKKDGRWLTKEAMKKEMDAMAFAVFTHNFPAIQPYEIVEFKQGG